MRCGRHGNRHQKAIAACVHSPSSDSCRLMYLSSSFGYICCKASELANMSIRHAVIALALLPWADLAYAHGIAGNRFFVGTLTFDDPAVADEAILPAFPGSTIRRRDAALLTTGSIGPLSGCSPRPSHFQSIAAGFTEAGPRRKHQDSIQLTLELRARFSEAMSTKLSFRPAWLGVSLIRVPQGSPLMSPTPFSRDCSSVGASVIYLIGSVGRDLSPLLERLWTSYRLEG